MKTYPIHATFKPKVLKVLKALNLLTFILTLVVNWLAVSLPLNNKSTGQLSDQYPNLFTPAGITFSVWSIIYLSTAIFVLYQSRGLFNKYRYDYVNRIVTKLEGWFILSNLLNVGWLFAWHYEQVGLSVLIMLCMLSTQLLLLWKAWEISDQERTWWQRFVVRFPFGLYAGWISIATIANVTALLVHLQWNQFGLSSELWAVGMIIVGTVLAQLVLFKRRSIAYGLVVIWALTGIIIKRYQSPMPDMSIIYVSEICIFILSLSILLISFTGILAPTRKKSGPSLTYPGL